MEPFRSEPADRHLEATRLFFEAAPATPRWAARCYRRLLARYYNLMIAPDASVLEIGCGGGDLLARIRAGKKTGVDLSERQLAEARKRVPDGEFHAQAGERLELAGAFDVIIISDTLNLAADVQRLLERLHAVSHPDTRLILNYHSNVWRPVLGLAELLGLKSAGPRSNWLATSDLLNLLRLSDWEPVARRPQLLLPVCIPVLDPLFNRWLAPLFPWLCLTVFCTARPAAALRKSAPMGVSVVIPARNEAGNIAAIVDRTPDMGAWTELIFVEGRSRDGTWEEIQRAKAGHPGRRIKIMRQTGEGKGNAVREGFAASEGEVLMILDADLTMPPEELPKFHAVVAAGRADFANGVRLVYPMDEKAMPFLNLIANKAFSLLFTWLLDQPVKDTLCGTKALRRRDYDRIRANQAYFGDFDPFGDFDLLFGAAKLNLKIADVPIRYRERVYGQTNIRRWRHGWLLFRMVLFAARKLKFV